MGNTNNQSNEVGSVGGRAGTIGAYIIIGVFGYMLLLGILFFGLAASGGSAWYTIYIPLFAIPGLWLGPLVLALRK